MPFQQMSCSICLSKAADNTISICLDCRPAQCFKAPLQHIIIRITTAMQARFQHNTVLTKEKCSQCWARFYCSGGCQANAHAFNGDISKPYEMECKLEQKRLECAMAIQAIERENA